MRFLLIFADFCRFSPFPRKRSIWETQVSAENRRFSQGTADFRRNLQKTEIGVCPLRFVPLSAALTIVSLRIWGRLGLLGGLGLLEVVYDPEATRIARSGSLQKATLKVQYWSAGPKRGCLNVGA